MYQPSYRKSKSGVPVLSKDEIDRIGENFIQDFQPEVLSNPHPVDIERFVECYLHMTTDYQYLSHNGIYLGMTVFNDTNKVPIYVPERNEADYISASAQTVIIDNQLLVPGQEHRYRFTLGHEGAHGILHSDYFSYNPSQYTLFDADPPMIQCRVDNTQYGHKAPTVWTDRDRMEFQANRLSSALLMPRCAIATLMQSFLGYNGHDTEVMALMGYAVASKFGVSREAAVIRLKELGYIPNTPAMGISVLEEMRLMA